MKDQKFEKEDIKALFGKREENTVKSREVWSAEDVAAMLELHLITQEYDKVLAIANRYLGRSQNLSDEMRGRFCFFKLLAACKARDTNELIHAILFEEAEKKPEFAEAKAHPCKDFERTLEGVEHFGAMKDEAFARTVLEACKKEKDDHAAAIHYQVLGMREEAKTRYRKLYEEAFEKDDYDTALRFYEKLVETYDDLEFYLKLNEYSGARKEFQAETGTISEHAEKICQQQAGEQYREYIREYTRFDNCGYFYGVPFVITCVVVLLCSIAMLFDRQVQSQILYIGWGVGVSVALHILIMMDFRFIRSCVMTALLCAIPMLLYTVLESQLAGAIVVFLLSGLLFAFAVRQVVLNIIGSRALKRAGDIRWKYLKPIVEAERARLCEKYEPRVGAEIMQKWLTGFGVPRW